MFKWIRRLAVFVVVLIIGIQCYRIHANIQHVLTYESMVKEVLAEDDIDNTTNVDLVLAMIYTETKGKTDDVMQSSESSTGVTNSITDRKESIRQGVTVLSENLEEAAHHKVDPWTAVQAYNFGKAYIDYVADNGGVNTVELAKAYSKKCRCSESRKHQRENIHLLPTSCHVLWWRKTLYKWRKYLLR